MQLLFVYFATFHKAFVTCVLLNYILNFGNSYISQPLKKLMLVVCCFLVLGLFVGFFSKYSSLFS